MAEIKHIGRVRSTKKKCVVAYRTLPGDAYYCLIVPTENLPDSYHDSLINLVESNAGQTAYEFAEAMMRTTFSDGSNMLAALHTQGRLIKVATSEIEMTPTTNLSIQLSELNQVIAEQRGISIDELSIKPSVSDNVEIQEVARVRDLGEPSIAEQSAIKTSSASINDDEQPLVTGDSSDPETTAKMYRSQADKLAK
jgi:hypothetical protein